MRVGLTYDLREDHRSSGLNEEDLAEFDRIDTIEALEAVLTDLGHEPDRIGHVKHLVTRLAAGDRWDLVFNIAEGLEGFGRESQVPALLEAYGIPHVFSDALTCALTLHKGMAKHVLRGLGVPTTPFAVLETEADAERVDLPFPLFVKPVAEGTSKGIGSDALVHDLGALRRTAARLIERFRQPVLVEPFLPGREVTVSVLGTGAAARVLGVMEVFVGDGAEGAIYSHENKEHYEGRVSYRLTDEATRASVTLPALAAWRGLGCRDGGRVDLRQDAGGSWQVLEINPLPGLHPVHSDLPITARLSGVSYGELVAEILASALAREPAPTRA